MQSKHITLVLQNLTGGGAERMMLNIAGGLADRGHRVDIVLMREEGPYLDRVPKHVTLICLQALRFRRVLPALVRYLRQAQPDAVLSTLVPMNIITAFASRFTRRRPRLVLREACSISGMQQSVANRVTRLSYHLSPWVYPWANHIVGISNDLRDELRQRLNMPAERINTIYNPVLSAHDQKQLERTPAPPHPWLEPGQVPVVIAVGRLVEQKDYVTLLDAFSQLRRREAARMIILGEGPLRSQLEQRIAALNLQDEVVLPGFVNEPLAWMQHAAVFAHTARWEGFGNVIVEALACGLPVVATDCPCGPAEILDRGRYGTLVPVGDVSALTNALATAITAPLPVELLRRRADDFTVESIVGQYESLLLG